MQSQRGFPREWGCLKVRQDAASYMGEGPSAAVVFDRSVQAVPLLTRPCHCSQLVWVTSKTESVSVLSLSPQGDLQRSLIQVDFGDGIAVSYANLSSTEDGIKHIYQNVGIFRVAVLVENSLGSDSAVLYLHVTCMYAHTPSGFLVELLLVARGDIWNVAAGSRVVGNDECSPVLLTDCSFRMRGNVDSLRLEKTPKIIESRH